MSLWRSSSPRHRPGSGDDDGSGGNDGDNGGASERDHGDDDNDGDEVIAALGQKIIIFCLIHFLCLCASRGVLCFDRVNFFASICAVTG